MWVKVFVTESPDSAQLDHLVTDDPAVPNEASETEVEWAILQGGPNGAGNAELANEGQVGENSKSVTRRYEFYEYTGAYDPENHEVMCGGDGSCNQPLPGEIGNYIGAQIAGINLVAEPPVSLPLAIAPNLSDGEVGELYDAPLVTGGTPPYTVTVTSGKLPSGLAVDEHGRLSGTPGTSEKNLKLAIQVTDETGASVTGSFSLNMVKGIHINTQKLKPGKSGKAYKVMLKASPGKPPYAWELADGSLPAGLTLDAAAGTISGVPAVTGSFNLTLQVIDSLGGQDEKSFTLVIK